MRRVYLNGAYLAPDTARVSVFDRGFVFGDGVYEVVPVYGGRAFRLPHHLARLAHSLDAVRIADPLAHADWEAMCARLIDENGGGDLSLYIEVTRGVAPRDHAFPDVAPTVFAYATPLTAPSPAQLRDGVAALTMEDIRWRRCDIKAIALLANVLARQEAIERGAQEAILVRDGLVTEGAASNVFIVQRDRVLTPPKGAFILPGITRDLVLELARDHGLACVERAFTKEELLSADEVWLTSSTKEVLPITHVDNRPIGGGRPGPLHAKLHGWYQHYKQAFREGRVD